LKWRLKTGGTTESSPVIGQDGTIYVGVNDRLWAILPDGKKKWEQPHAGLIRTSPVALADNTVCFLSGSGVLINLDTPHQFNWEVYLGVPGFQPTLGADGRIYGAYGVAQVGYAIEAFPAAATLAQSPWPKFRGNRQNTGRPQAP
jgi:outer membrane protein assembly factor BamB